MWLPEVWNGSLSVEIGRAIEAGLTVRSVEETVRDTFDWMRSGPDTSGTLTSGMKLGAALARDREASLLDAWRAKQHEPTRQET